MSKIKECLTLADKCENPRAVSFKMAVERLERTADNILVQDFWKLFFDLGTCTSRGFTENGRTKYVVLCNATVQCNVS